LGEGVDNFDLGVDFDGVAIEQSRRVTPLADSGDGRFRERANSTDAIDLGNLAVFADDSVDFHGAGNVFTACFLRVRGLDSLDQSGRLNISAYCDARYWRSLAWVGGMTARRRVLGRVSGRAEVG
jgi:hypothetical protein